MLGKACTAASVALAVERDGPGLMANEEMKVRRGWAEWRRESALDGMGIGALDRHEWGMAEGCCRQL